MDAMGFQQDGGEHIRSRQNPRVKALSRLRDRAGRRDMGVFLVEGLRELSRAVEAAHVEEIYYAPELFMSPAHTAFVERIRAEGKVPLCRLSESAFEKVSNREGADGIVGVVGQWPANISDLSLPEGAAPLILAADSIEKPGNLGALMRTADSLGADAFIASNPVTDIFNPAAVRSSQGALFSIQMAVSTPAEAAGWLRERGIKMYAAHLEAEKSLWQADFSGPCAIVVGSERSGLGAEWDEFIDERIKVPMSGVSDSMNVNVASAVFLYEALRQRRLLR